MLERPVCCKHHLAQCGPVLITCFKAFSMFINVVSISSWTSKQNIYSNWLLALGFPALQIVGLSVRRANMWLRWNTRKSAAIVSDCISVEPATLLCLPTNHLPEIKVITHVIRAWGIPKEPAILNFPQTVWLTLGVLTVRVKGRGARSRCRTESVAIFVVSCLHVYFSW